MKKSKILHFFPTPCVGAKTRTLNALRLFMVALYFGAPILLLAQGGEPNCRTDLDCDIKAEIVLLHNNVSTDCSVNDACGGGDNFRQVFYKVRLKYTTTNSMSDRDFYLDYDELSVSVALAVTSNAPRFSRINTKVTNSCYQTGIGSNWGNTSGGNTSVASFSVEPYAASINFADFNIDPCDGDKIHFTDGGCISSPYCAYADLFVVAVEAYPGEEIQLKITNATYDPGVGQACELAYNQPSAITVASPAAPSTAPNNNLLLQLASAVTNNDGCYIDLELTNSSSTDIFIDFFEFLVKISPDPTMPPFEITSSYDDPPIKVGGDYFVRFSDFDNFGLNVPGSTTIKLGRIVLKKPVVQNMAWNAVVALVDDNKSRLKTTLSDLSNACSRLRLDTEPESCDGGMTPCDYPVSFKIWAPENVSANCPSAKKVKIGLVSPSLTNIDVRRLAFELKFDLEAGAALSSVVIHELCDENNPSGCLGFMGSTESDCWKIVGDDVLKFCFDVTSEPDPVTLNLSSTTAYLEAVFNTAGCIKGVSIVSLEMTPESPLEDCFPTLETIPDPFVLCEPQIFGELATESGLGLADATVTLTPISGSCSTPCSADTKTSTDAPNAGNYSFCPCFTCTKFEVSSGKNNDPLNGVSTFDLVLINKHILALEVLGSPYKMIAADANKSRAITTLDIVELRKLILGIYPTGLPSNTSWRFVDKDYSFPDPTDPFTTVFPEKKEVNISPSGSAQEANFVAIKVGDVNNNAIASAQARPVTSVARMQSGAATRAGEIITVPVTYTGTESLEAFQLGIRFDPAVLRLIGPSQGDLPHFNAGNFGLTHVEQGEIRSLWFADPATPDEALRSGDILFYLSFQVKRHLPASAVLFDLDDKILPNAAWKPEGTEFALQSGQAAEDRAQEATLTTSSLKAVCQPNPTTGTAQLKVHADRAGNARLAIFGPFGRREWMKEVELNPGEQIFEIPEVAQLPAGVYFWKVLAPWGKTQGHLIKQ